VLLFDPKSRGSFGEIMLESIIENLPQSYYERQYKIGSNIVDYVIKVNNHLIPIDAKFPIYNFKNSEDKQKYKKELIRKLKEKIEDVARKYISPSNGTTDFAIIYSANESIYMSF
jgi:DNA recombination protein RmuC